MYGVLISRFTEATFQETIRYRETNKIKCIYGATRRISESLPDCPYFMIEMNNDTNQIMGIGVITKELAPRTKVYANPYFNRYLYKGDYYIPAEQIKQDIIEELEQILFYGRNHLKRGGITLFPPSKMKKEYIHEFKSKLNATASVATASVATASVATLKPVHNSES